MSYAYPTPNDVGIRISPHLRPDRFSAGFQHALRGGQLDRGEFLRLSFRIGYRSAKLYLRELRRRQNILDFPMKAKFRFKLLGD